MFKKSVFVLILFAIQLFTLGSGSAPADPKNPTWQEVFVPPLSESTVVWALEPFKNQLYAAVANYPTGMQIYRSSNGTDWQAVTKPGFGIDPHLYVSWDMTSYQGKMYVSVHDIGSHETPGRIMRSRDGVNWETVFLVDDSGFAQDSLPAAFGEFNGMLYVAVDSFDSDSYGQIWRSQSGDTGTWEQVFSVFNSGFGAPLTAYNGFAYISGWNSTTGTMGAWRSSDGLSWESIGMGVLDVPENYGDGSIQAFRGTLYLSTQSSDGGRIYRSSDGLNWQPVVTGGFGDPTLYEINGLIIFKDDLYACGTAYDENGVGFAKVYRSHSGNSGDWEPVPTESWGPYSGTNRMEEAVFKGNLYVANFNFNQTSSVNKLIGK
jgi:hypothetical protein